MFFPLLFSLIFLLGGEFTIHCSGSSEAQNEMNITPSAHVYDYAPLVSKPAQRLAQADLKLLLGPKALNHKVIDHYLELIGSVSPGVFVFQTFFYNAFKDGGYNSVEGFTRYLDLFSCKLLFFPIHVNNGNKDHWSLAVAEVPTKTLYYFDSLNDGGTSQLKVVQAYLQHEYSFRNGAENYFQIGRFPNEIPMQLNEYDSGVFVLMYAHEIIVHFGNTAGNNNSNSGFSLTTLFFQYSHFNINLVRKLIHDEIVLNDKSLFPKPVARPPKIVVPESFKNLVKDCLKHNLKGRIENKVPDLSDLEKEVSQIYYSEAVRDWTWTFEGIQRRRIFGKTTFKHSDLAIIGIARILNAEGIDFSKFHGWRSLPTPEALRKDLSDIFSKILGCQVSFDDEDMYPKLTWMFLRYHEQSRKKKLLKKPLVLELEQTESLWRTLENNCNGGPSNSTRLSNASPTFLSNTTPHARQRLAPTFLSSRPNSFNTYTSAASTRPLSSVPVRPSARILSGQTSAITCPPPSPVRSSVGILHSQASTVSRLSDNNNAPVGIDVSLQVNSDHSEQSEEFEDNSTDQPGEITEQIEDSIVDTTLNEEYEPNDYESDYDDSDFRSRRTKIKNNSSKRKREEKDVVANVQNKKLRAEEQSKNTNSSAVPTRDPTYNMGKAVKKTSKIRDSEIRSDSDHSLLMGENRLNEAVINEYLQLIAFSANDVYIFDTSFFAAFAKNGHEHVRDWNDYSDVFFYRLLLFPIRIPLDTGMDHWSLAVAELDTKLLYYFDSVYDDGEDYLNQLQDYLNSEHLARLGTNIVFEQCNFPIHIPKQQKDKDCDCGVFVLQYAKEIVQWNGDNLKILTFEFSQKNMTEIRTKMFDELESGKIQYEVQPAKVASNMLSTTVVAQGGEKTEQLKSILKPREGQPRNVLNSNTSAVNIIDVRKRGVVWDESVKERSNIDTTTQKKMNDGGSK